MTPRVAVAAAVLWICTTTVVCAQSAPTSPTTPATSGTLRTKKPALQPPSTIRANSRPPPPQTPTSLRTKPAAPKPPDDLRTKPPPPSSVPVPDPNRDPARPGVNPAASGTLITRPPSDPEDDDDARDVDGRQDTATPSGTPPSSAPSPQIEVPPAPAADAAAEEANEELPRELLLVAMDLDEAEAQRQWFSSQGVGVVRRVSLGNLQWVLTTYRIPPTADSQALIDAALATWPTALAEMNQRYSPLEQEAAVEKLQTGAAGASPILYAAALVALPPQGCMSASRIAMLDGPLNASLATFAGRRINVIDIAARADEPRYEHASAIAALWLGDGATPGIVPNAELFAANVFGERDGKSFTTTEWVVRGLDWVLGQKPIPSVVNLSFGGPGSAVLARAIERVQERARVVAAGGNDGTAEPVFPAALPGVVGVTAVDARRKAWTLANTGEHVAIAAPGVDVWTTDGAGNGYYASGTSFASAFVTAALALLTPSQEELDAWLKQHTLDLGPAGRDPQFGWGLLQAGGLCK